MPCQPRPLPSSLTFSVFTTAEARAAGVPAARLRALDLKPLARGLWAKVEEVSTERDIVAAWCRLDGAVFAAGLTAARLWGFPLPGVLEEEVVTAPRPSRRTTTRRTAPRQIKRTAESTAHGPAPSAVDARIHLGTTATRRRDTALMRWSSLSVAPETLDGEPTLQITPRLRTMRDLAGILELDGLVAVGDHLVRRPRQVFDERVDPYATIDELKAEADQFRGPGAKNLREAVDLVRMSSDSPAETRLRLVLARAGLPEPLANVPAVSPLGGGQVIGLGEPDLHWPRWRVALEHDGPTHLNAEQLPKDIARGERRHDAGWIEVRTTAKDLHHDCRSGVDRVRNALLRHGWSPT